MEKIECKICHQNLLDGKDKVQNLSAKSFGWKRSSAIFVSKISWMEKVKCKICQQNLLDGKDNVQNLSAKSFGSNR